MAKKLIINCGDCDARNVSEETLAAYESIIINAGDVLVTPESKILLNRYGVTMNCGDVLELEKDVQLSRINGSAQIKSTDIVPARTCLVVNGTLDIGPNTQKVLQQYVGISVNGSVTYPESMSSFLRGMSINGSTVCYPDDAIVLKRNAVIDKVFALRARNKRYWSAKRMIMVDPELDAAALAAKGATFSTKEVILAQAKVEELIGLIDETAEIVIVPDGTSVIRDDVALEDALIRKYGTKLYILGDLRIPKEAGEALAQLEYLNVQGDVSVTEAWKGLLLEKAAQISGDIRVIRGRTITDKMSARISKWMLEQEPEGISVVDCMKVRLDEDIPNEWILERLSIRDCMNVECTPEQESALAAVCEDVMNIGQGGGDTNLGVGDILKGALGGAKELLDTKVINAGDYVL